LRLRTARWRSRRAYETVVFVLTGERQPYRLGLYVDELTMVKSLA